MTTDTENKPDLLYGIHAIADFLGIKERSAYHLCETRRIPFFKVGKTVCARRSTLTAKLAELEEASQSIEVRCRAPGHEQGRDVSTPADG